MANRPIPFRTKGYGLRGVIVFPDEMKYALDGMVDRLYEGLTDTVQANGLHHRWVEHARKSKVAGSATFTGTPLPWAIEMIRANSRPWHGIFISDVTRYYMALQILEDCDLGVCHD